MDQFTGTENELAELVFRAKAAAYVSPMTVKAWQDAGREDFLLVDARKRMPRPKKRIASSLWFPQPEIDNRFAELPKDKLIVLYCWDVWCSLATSAALVLIEHGYRVKELYGGIAAWEALHLPEIDVDRPTQ